MVRDYQQINHLWALPGKGSANVCGKQVVKDIMVGDDAAAVRTMLQITYPVLLAPSCIVHELIRMTDG